MFENTKWLNKKLLKDTLAIRLFGLSKVAMILYVAPTLLHWDEEKIVFKIPLNRLTRNHMGAMYFGALAVGADIAAGYAAIAAIHRSGRNVSFVFKDMKGEFLKRAEGDAHFTCKNPDLVEDLVQKAIETGERVDLSIPVEVTVPSKLGAEPVARFALTLSLKLKEGGKGGGKNNDKTKKSQV